MTRRSRSGFTLLEVMGAVAILGLVAASLMTASINSARISGDARDRMAASLLADSLLAELETAAARGDGSVSALAGERAIDGFDVAVAVTPFDPATLGLEPLVDRERGGPPAAALAADPRGPAPLSWMRIDVTSIGGVEVTRTSIAFDPTASAALAELADRNEGAE